VAVLDAGDQQIAIFGYRRARGLVRACRSKLALEDKGALLVQFGDIGVGTAGARLARADCAVDLTADINIALRIDRHRVGMIVADRRDLPHPGLVALAVVFRNEAVGSAANGGGTRSPFTDPATTTLCDDGSMATP
jgi:hypothetical protein